MELSKFYNKSLPSNLKFKGVWRSYQQRVLQELQLHLYDKKLNVVAAPGAGKTTLGIEVVRRLNKPTLILAPTITIKNQWKQRIIEGFCENNDNGDWISTDINKISVVTVSTYQGLHTIFKEKNEKENFIKTLKENNIKTLVLDEAHHLRKEWYESLTELIKNIDCSGFTTVSLTATPPYDVNQKEWGNYHSLCGSVDAEIAIPELVKNGDLCPHQDLIYFSDLSEEEKNILFDYDSKRKEFFKFINKNFDFLYAVEGSIFFQDFDNNIELIYEDTEFTISLISYLLSIDELNIKANMLVEFLGLTKDNIPKFDYKIAETLINGMLGKYENYFFNTATIKAKLKELNLLKGKKACLFKNEEFETLFSRSINKLNAIKKITELEYNNLKDKLREVILLDFIGQDKSYALNIISLFENLYSTGIDIGILTGSIIVIPEKARKDFYKILENKNIDKTKALAAQFRKDYIRIELFGDIDIVSILTELFARGMINIIIGTTALLGEGWDSPCINTLIIGSIVGSFMLSNQIRGRALRIDKNNPEKISNIWHIASLTQSDGENTDLEIIEKRFNTFEGVSYYNNVIQNGIDRLALDDEALKNKDIDKLNEISFNFAFKRNELRQKWEQVFTESEIVEEKMCNISNNKHVEKDNNICPADNQQVFDVIKYNFVKKEYILKKVPFIYKWVPKYLEKYVILNKQNFLINLIAKNLIKNEIISKDYKDFILNNTKVTDTEEEQKKLANCLLEALCSLGFVKTYFNDMQIKLCTDKISSTYLTVMNCTNYERTLFIKSFYEIFNINEDSRYILKKDDKFLGVPEIFSGKRETVSAFTDILMEKFGYFDIIYTRVPTGYKEFLKAKYNLLISINTKKSRVLI